MRVLELAANATPREWGRAHGETFRGEIRSLTDIRLYLTVRLGSFGDEATVLRVAEAHLPVLAHYDPDLHDELCGIAEGAGLSPAHLVVLNHYTDLRDIDPRSLEPGGAGVTAAGGWQGDAGGCSVLWARTPAGPILAQTWDMHATAIPYVMMLHVPEGGETPETWLFSLTGCLGMTGINRHGMAMAINNLNSIDARIGIVWPALVRRALRERTAAAARDLVLRSPVGSGHHYMVADSGAAWGIETSGTLKHVMFEGSAAQATAETYIHTNHCLSPEVHAMSRVPAASTTHARYDALRASVAARAVADVHDAWTRLGSHDGYPRSVCTNMATPENPHGSATCGAIAMELGTPRVWAQAGFIHHVAPERFAFVEAA